MIYKCEVCGEEMLSIEKMKEHERKCCQKENLIRMISELKSRISILEHEIAELKSRREWNIYTQLPTYPSNPWITPCQPSCGESGIWKVSTSSLSLDNASEKTTDK